MAGDELVEELEEKTTREEFVRQASAAGASVLLFGAGASVASATHIKNPRVGFGQPDRGAAVVKALFKAAHGEAKRKGWKVLESFASGSAAKQIGEINTWIAQGVDVIVVLPLEPKALGPLIKKAHRRGLKFVGYAANIPGNDGYINWDNPPGARELGEHAGRWINRTLRGNAEVAFLTAEFHPTGRARIHGAEAALRRVAPRAKVVARQQAILAADALKASQSILQANPNLNVMICIADDGCIGARSAFLATGRPRSSMYIAGFDGSKPALELLLRKDDPVRAVAALDIALIGRSVVDLADNLVHGVKPTSRVVPYILVDQSSRDRSTIRRLLKAYPA